MQTELTHNRLSGRAIGSLFFTGFGALWLILALYAFEKLTPVSAGIVACGASSLIGGAVWLLRRAKTFPRVPNDPEIGRAFTRINAIQWFAVALVAFSFARLHIDAYVMSAITAIVGLHMFPLAKLFKYPMHHFTGAVLVVWAAASALFLSKETMQGATALGTAAILWTSALITLYLAMGLLRRGKGYRQPLTPITGN